MKGNNLIVASAISLILCSASIHADFKISGAVEAEVSSVNSDSNGDSSDIAVPTVEFGIEAAINEQVDVVVVLKASDVGTVDQTDVEIDEAVLNFAVANGIVTIGQTTVPFGSYETSALSDPLTLVLGETGETVLSFTMENESGITFSGYLFNGDVDDGDDAINDIVLSASLVRDNWSFGADYLSNLGDSDSLQEVPAAGNNVAGLALHGLFTSGNMTFIFEHVTAMDKFNAGAVNGLEPSATHVEVDFDLGNDQLVAVSFSSSDDADGLIDYETQTAVAYSSTLLEDVGLTIEVANAKEYNGNKDTVITAQLGVEF